jgi:8-oxo-dGTP pyrophosphatase MutT (NUDIX family)
MAEGARRETPNPDQAGAVERAALLRDADALISYLSERLAPLPMRSRPETDPAAEPLLWTPEPGMERVAEGARHAAVLAPIFARDGAPWILFTRRASDLKRHSGEISFPGGGRDPGDATLAQTALREAQEELALEPAHVQLLGALPTAYLSVSDFVVTTYVGWLGDGLPDLTPARGEVAEVIEAPLAALDDPAIYHEEIWKRGGFAHTVVFYDYGAYRVWGLTGRLLNHLLSLLPPRE